jgi:hypothetical protein
MTINMEGFTAEMEGQKRWLHEAKLAARGAGGKWLELVAVSKRIPCPLLILLPNSTVCYMDPTFGMQEKIFQLYVFQWPSKSTPWDGWI